MLDILIMLGIGAYAFGSKSMDMERDSDARKNAKAAGKKHYYDHKCKMRSVETNELCEYGSLYWHLGIVYKDGYGFLRDFTQEEADEYNRRLEAEGKKYYYKEFRGLNYANGTNTWYPVEKETGLPFRIYFKHVFPAYLLFSDERKNKKIVMMEYLYEDKTEDYKFNKDLKTDFHGKMPPKDGTVLPPCKEIPMEEVECYINLDYNIDRLDGDMNRMFERYAFPQKREFGRNTRG